MLDMFICIVSRDRTGVAQTWRGRIRPDGNVTLTDDAGHVMHSRVPSVLFICDEPEEPFCLWQPGIRNEAHQISNPGASIVNIPAVPGD